jgi:signal transduction histidine kinase/ligand-binding sensor domain-containing protein
MHLTISRGRCAATLLLFLAPALLPALDPSLAITQYARRHWTVEDGLPQNYVTTLTQAPDGALLIATSGGVARFDGFRFSPVPLDSTSGLTREWINSIALDSDGVLWIGSRDAGLFRNKDGDAHHVPLSNTQFSSMLPSTSGGVLALGMGLWRLEKSQWRLSNADLAPPDLGWEGLLSLGDGTLLVASVQGLFAVRGTTATPLLPHNGPAGQVLCLRSPRPGAIYAGTTRGLFLLRLQGSSAQAEQIAGVPGPVVSIAHDRDGAVWTGTWGHGLHRTFKGVTNSWTTSAGLPADFVHAVFEDREGSIWVGTRGGLSRLSASRLVPYGPPEGLGGSFVSVVAGSADGSLFAATWRSGLYRRRGSRFEAAGLPANPATMVIRAVAAGPDNTLWLSAWSTLWRHDGSGWHDYGGPELGHDPRVTAIVVEDSAKLWLGTLDGLYEYPPGPIRAPGRRRAEGAVHCLLRASDGRLWAGTDRGLTVITAGGATAIGGLPRTPVIALVEDAQARIWAAGRAGGLSLITREGVQNFDTDNGLPDFPVLSLLQDTRGDFWLGTSHGLYRISADQLPQLQSGRAAPIRYGQHDGMRTIECHNVGQPAAWRDRVGSLWFTTAQGVIEVKTTSARGPLSPAVLVESISTEARDHTIRFGAVALAAPHRTEFRYMLESRAPEWTHLGAERVLRFSGLAAGTHRVALSARDVEGSWSEPAWITLHQPPRWFETWAFRAAAAAFVACSVWFVHRRRVGFLKGRYAAVMAERNRIAREWHDTLLAGFSAISWQLDATLMRFRQTPDEVADSIDLARRMVKHYRAEARRVIWDLRDEQADPVSLPDAVRQAFKRITAKRQVAGGVMADERFPQLPADLSLNLLRIAQEAITNACEHGARSSIEVQLRHCDGFVVLTVSDDGAGFDSSQSHPGHFGLAIMKERAQKLGGTCDIASAAGGGTIVSARIPWTC